MSLRDCLETMVRTREISRAEADSLVAAFERLRSGKARETGDAGAAIGARDELVKRLEAEAAEKKRQAQLTIGATERLRAEITGFRNWRGKADVGEAIVRLFENHGRTGYSSVAGRANAITAQAHARMEGLLAEFGRTFLTGARKNKARLDNVAREAFGEGTGDAAAAGLAKAWKDTSDWLRRRFNEAGGAIAELKDWGLPQSHDRIAMMRAGKARWKAEIMPRLAPERMRHPLTDAPMTTDELDAALDHVWESIVREGWNTREPSRRTFGTGALANQRQDHRFLAFKSADDWLSYQRDFGNPDVFATMMSHINLMARDIAAMEILGPNPAATVEWLRQVLRQEAARAQDGASDLLPVQPFAAASTRDVRLREIDALWAQLRGAAELPVRQWLGDLGAGVRNVIVAARLGAAPLSAVTGDPVTMSIAGKFIGLSEARLLRRLAGEIAGGSDARIRAVRSGMILEEAQHVLRESARWHGSLAGPEWTRVLPDRVLTLNGLQAWTQAAKHAFGREMMAFAADEAGKAWSDVTPAFRRMAEGYGFGEAEWEIARHAVREVEGARFLEPSGIAALEDPRGQAVAERFTEMILGETEYAVPSGHMRGRLLLTGGSRPGTFWGEVTRSAAMFRAFGVSVAMLQGGRIATELGAGRWGRGGAFVGGALITLTLGGALGLWLKDLAKGRDPQPANGIDFWLAAAAQGGGLGSFGDFLFADANRFGNSLGATLLGPGASLVEDLWKMTVGNTQKLIKGDETSFGADVARFARGYTPGGTIWYLNAAYQRVIMDQLQYLLDPKASQKFKRQVRSAERERGQGFWWAPGELAPSRAPALP